MKQWPHPQKVKCIHLHVAQPVSQSLLFMCALYLHFTSNSYTMRIPFPQGGGHCFVFSHRLHFTVRIKVDSFPATGFLVQNTHSSYSTQKSCCFNSHLFILLHHSLGFNSLLNNADMTSLHMLSPVFLLS